MSAQLTRTFEGRSYRLYLHPAAAYTAVFVATWPTDGSGSPKMLELDVTAPQ